MGRFLDAAYSALRSKGRPMDARELTQAALDRGFLVSTGKTPWQTMKSKLSVDILKKRNGSLFMRTSSGLFGLREWRGQHSEHIADRFQKALIDEDIVVIPANAISLYVPGSGLHRNISGRSPLRFAWSPMRRSKAEVDLSVIQLVSVFLIRYKNKYLTYKRAKRLPEARLHGFYSIAFGGHLNPDDMPDLLNILVPEQGLHFLLRELTEEVRLEQDVLESIDYRGLLYDTSRDVSKQHLGIVYDVTLRMPKYEIGERGFLMDPKFETLDQILSRLEEFENWSALLAREENRRARANY